MESEKILKNYNKKYYDNNKEKIIKHLYEYRTCNICNRDYRLYQLSRHYKTNRHINILKQKNINNITDKNE